MKVILKQFFSNGTTDPGGSGGTGGAGPGSGPGNGPGNGPGTGPGNGSTNNGLSDLIIQAATKQALITLCSISPSSCDNANILLNRSCEGVLWKLSKFVTDNNMNAIALCIASQKIGELVENTQSSNSACGQNLNLPNLSNISTIINSNLINYSNIFPQINGIVCELYNNNLFPLQRLNLSNAIYDYLSPILNNPIATSSNGSTGLGDIPADVIKNIEILINLTEHISNNQLEKNNFLYLLKNPIELISLNNYLYNSAETTKNSICLEHIQEVTKNIRYAEFQKIHIQSGNSNLVWWLDENWLNNTNNFQLNVVDGTNQYSRLTAQEKALATLFPTQAFAIKENVEEAFNMTDTKMGIADSGLNDKKDAFRHTFFNAINSRDVPPKLTPIFIPSSIIVRMFGEAHESEVPNNLILEKQMDLNNNDVGINYCWNCLPGISTNENIANDILQMLNNGNLLYLKPINYNDPNFQTTHGILSSTKLTPTNL